MDRRAWVASSGVLAVLSVGWVAAAATWIHRAQWSIHRQDLHRSASLQGSDPSSAAALPPSSAPRVLSDVFLATDTALPLIAAMLLGVALVSAGHRRWGPLAPVLLNLLAIEPFTPLGGRVLGSTDLAATPSLWWPGTEVLLQAVIAALPAVVAVVIGGRRPRDVRPVAGRAAGWRSTAVGLAFVLLGVPLSPTALGAGEPVAVAHAVAVVLVVACSGLVAGGCSRRTLLLWVSVTLALAGTRILLRSGLVFGRFVPLSPSDAGGVLLVAFPVLLGIVATLTVPWFGRQWVRVFRSGRGEGVTSPA